MRLTMADRKSLAKVFIEKYRYASKREKIVILNEFIEYTKHNRSYASRVLRSSAPAMNNKIAGTKRKHAPRYDDDVKAVLKKIWETSDYLCGKRLVSIIPEMVRKFGEFDEMDISDPIKEKLLKISAATVDRLLSPSRKTLGRHGTSMTKSTRYLIDRIPVKTFGEWKETPAGFTQVDLVAHNGGNVYGGFLYTLNTTDVSTSWTVCTLVQDKTMPEMLKALSAMKEAFPYPIRGIHSDNGSEFINDSVLGFARENTIVFTRGRPYKKNDNPHIEQKNNSILRRNTGYLRYDKPEHAEVLDELYTYLNLYVNYFQPTMILVEKHRIGAKAIRKYDKPKTPYQRLLERMDVSDTVKRKVKKIYAGLNPASLKRIINHYQADLIHMAAPIRVPIAPVRIRRKKEMKHTLPVWRREMIATKPNPFLERQRIEELKRASNLVLDKRKIKSSK
ncbi:DDE-type integrase/transposase/recombinase [Candidatus Dependentiae bacterium]|nr:DDE-type integrase/transposase/recombinase [Candidatus Dependentiae bacterium]